jgi:RES domain-containing protein
MRLWRISRFATAAQAFDGEGARQYPGRWNPPGVPVVYTSSSLPLAALELLVHADVQHLRGPFFAYSVDVPARLLERPATADLPADWRDVSDPASARAFGGAWAVSLRSLALVVPSIVVPTDENAVLNPRHPAFARMEIAAPIPFSFDPRMVKGNPGENPPRRG